jgi:tetratricopeptide (TPR) repeat protein
VRAGEHAAAEERKAKAVVDLLLETFGATDPHAGAIGDSVSIGALLDQGEERAADLDAQPEVQAALRHALGRIRLERGNYERARELLGAARDAEIARLGEADPATVPVRMNYARSLHASRRQDEAERELRASLAVLEASPGGDPEVEAAVLMVLASVVHGEEGVRALERAVALMRERRDRDPVGYADVLTGLALMRRMTGDEDDARALYREALPLYVAALGAEAPRTLVTRSNLASLLEDPAARVAEHREVLELRRRRLGDQSNQVANSWNHLGLALADLGELGEAEDAYRRAEEIWIRLGGPEHPLALRALHNRARTLVLRGRLEEAEQVYAELEERLGRAHGADDLAAAVRADLDRLRARGAGESSDGGPLPAASPAHASAPAPG